MKLILIGFLCSCATAVLAAPKIVQIGALFHGPDSQQEIVFKYAIEKINTNRSLHLVELSERVKEHDNLEVHVTICDKMLAQGVWAIFGPQSSYTADHVQSICDVKEIPHIETRYDVKHKRHDILVNLYPHPSALSKVYLDLVHAWKWKSFTVIYEDNDGLDRISLLLKLNKMKGYTIVVRKLNSGSDFRPMLRKIKRSGETNFVLDCSFERLPEILKQALQVGLLIEENSFIITQLDMHNFDLEPYQHGGANITGIRLVNPDDPFVKETVEEWARFNRKGRHFHIAASDLLCNSGVYYEKEERESCQKILRPYYPRKKSKGNAKELLDGDREITYGEERSQMRKCMQTERDAMSLCTPSMKLELENDDDDDDNDEDDDKMSERIMAESALLYDAVHLFAKTVQRMFSSRVNATAISCDYQDNWLHGFSLVNLMKDNHNVHRGLTGPVLFDNEGFRSSFILDVIELTTYGLQKIGSWNSSEGLNLRRLQPPPDGHMQDSIANKTLRVLTAISLPYGMRKDSSDQLLGNDRYEGFAIDIIREISLILGFNYTFELQEDFKYGSYNNITGEWDGMIRRLQDNEADLAITDLTITAERQTGADFTLPFMNLGISILYKKPSKASPMLFSFMDPFSMDVWIVMFFGYIGVSLILFIMGRICPYEWTNPYPCIEEPETLENQFSLKNSLWFTIGSLMQQGSELAPIAVSTRMIAGIWWFFTLIMVSSYTANLAAFLTVESMSQPFRAAEDLVDQTEIKYGAKRSGSTLNFFRDSDNPIFQRMYQYMVTTPGVLTVDNDEGLEKVKNENYAFFMESSSIEYFTERNCDVQQYGGLLDNKGYGIAMRKEYPYHNELNGAVLQLQETGKLMKLKDRWWKEERGGGQCQSPEAASATSSLKLENVGGVFVVLAVGTVLAIFIAILELLWSVGQTAYREKVSFLHELLEELKFIAKFHGSTKPVRKYHQEADGEAEDHAQNGIPMNPYPYGFINNSKEPLT
ncbi:glutamate receptor ionotropic, kainate 2-like [Anabrus simplex]|uniref:glutamate receptor ionotropic, kainate 2-like n=1 Tax=Anabrus simplex TaxID=316456 RepID=UPI0035A2B6D6